MVVQHGADKTARKETTTRTCVEVKQVGSNVDFLPVDDDIVSFLAEGTTKLRGPAEKSDHILERETGAQAVSKLEGV